MNFISRSQLERLKEEYPRGTRVELVRMEDTWAKLVPGDKGTVEYIDDVGTIFVRWDCGSGLGVAWGEDEIKKI